MSELLIHRNVSQTENIGWFKNHFVVQGFEIHNLLQVNQYDFRAWIARCFIFWNHGQIMCQNWKFHPFECTSEHQEFQYTCLPFYLDIITMSILVFLIITVPEKVNAFWTYLLRRSCFNLPNKKETLDR